MSGNNEVELKGGMYAFISLKLYISDLDGIDKHLADKVQQAPAFFKGAPVVVDLTPIEEQLVGDSAFDSDALLERIRAHNLVPIVASLADKSSTLAQSIAIPLIERSANQTQSTNEPANSSTDDDTDADNKTETAEAEQASAAPELALTAQEVQVVIKAPLLIDKPVRSGQQIYARDTDLIVMGPIGPGAEVIADNNIHVYGPLRGRALCGVSGNTNTRIFCKSLEAELVSVAGSYRLLEEIPENLRGKPAQIWLDGEKLNIEPL